MYLWLADFFENGFLGRYSDLFMYYAKSLRRWNDFSGRSSLQEFWLTNIISGFCNFLILLIASLIGLAITFVFSLPGNDIISGIGSLIAGILGLVVFIGLMIPGLSLLFRRLHDVNKSALWLLTLLCCGLGIIPLAIFILGNSVDDGNKFGPAYDNNQSYQSYSGNQQYQSEQSFDSMPQNYSDQMNDDSSFDL